MWLTGYLMIHEELVKTITEDEHINGETSRGRQRQRCMEQIVKKV